MNIIRNTFVTLCYKLSIIWYIIINARLNAKVQNLKKENEKLRKKIGQQEKSID